SNSYNPGNAMYLSASYAIRGFGVTWSGKRIDNMDFRSDRAATGSNLNLNYLPAITKQHTYILPAIYPYATQPTGEVGWQADVIYTIPRDTWLGGRYGVDVSVNYAEVHRLGTTAVNEFEYPPTFPGASDRRHY